MAESMVRWPGDWEDSGEGGMYVWALVTDGDADEPECIVDTALMLSEPDAIQSDTGGQHARALWDPLAGVPGPMRLSQGLSAAVLLGSTSACPFDGMEYFQATLGDLTEDGRKLVELLERTTGGQVRLLTLLDT